ncbi:MAG: Protein of unknown function (DUF2852) [Rhodobacteraceae bacterium HLUCCO18]|nr:MAG: Protein of unknown function (DUF2852) [Rhodobacteraceae bacterium HLUCCO18]
MTTSTTQAPMVREAQNWFARAEAWLDARGKVAWIATLVLAFIIFWPIGLALLAYMIWSKRMFNGSCNKSRHATRHAFRSSGNSAFDAYKADTLRRLEEEQEAFEAFLQRLRDAKDKAEFDQFMDDRTRSANRDAGDTAQA